MNILPALQHHLHNTHAYKWEHHQDTNSLTTTIQTPSQHRSPYKLHHTTTITITQNDNILTITQTTHHQDHTTTIDLLDQQFLNKTHKTILKQIHQILTPHTPN